MSIKQLIFTGIKCDLPRGDPNAWTPVNSKEFQSTLTYTCLNGFEAGGSMMYTVDCQANGKWGTPSDMCEGKLLSELV